MPYCWSIVLAILSIIHLLSAGQVVPNDKSVRPLHDYYRICPLPKCERCSSIEEIRSPGIGLILETSHGAAAIRHHNGTYQHVGLINGDAPYTALLHDLYTGPQDRQPAHIDSNWEKFLYVKNRAQRHMNKLLGRPATPDTAVLAAMVFALLDETRKQMSGQPIVAAILSSPDHIRLTDEETKDIFDYLGIRNLMAEPDSLENLYSTSAAYAGHGRGLCDSYTDAYACEKEEWYLPDQTVLHIDFNRETLSGIIKSLRRAVELGAAHTSFIDPDLGYGRLNLIPEPNVEAYWTAISTRIRALAVSYERRIDELLLTGTSATNARFQAAVKDALGDIVADHVLSALGSGDEDERKEFLSFATARGAAEVAKRRQEGPIRCAQSDACRERRERERTEL
ncbi:hypothetical protein K461DRAFT_246983 [Myriangium duriaei CBS 260.36]|uniref:Uncharacterized protein n=1 Tax=Myriangium duriaei CBS 260.36 TaxID=1168546 RepID=A0A9P4IVZ0_9PEZI|nr:hypothetical protein K461DRAFT_246983 [Myriangium duriaei CBS 260.36]